MFKVLVYILIVVAVSVKMIGAVLPAKRIERHVKSIGIIPTAMLILLTVIVLFNTIG